MLLLTPKCQVCGAPGIRPPCPGCDRRACLDCRTYAHAHGGIVAASAGVLCCACMAGAVEVPVGRAATATEVG